MAELCGAFNRIVPRYQFATNNAAFMIEDMGDNPKRYIPNVHRVNNGKCTTGWNGPSPCPYGNTCNVGLQNRPFSMYVHRKCHWPKGCNGSRCSSMDTCGNVRDKMCYYHSLEY